MYEDEVKFAVFKSAMNYFHSLCLFIKMLALYFLNYSFSSFIFNVWYRDHLNR
jgi:hypothetical protein